MAGLYAIITQSNEALDLPALTGSIDLSSNCRSKVFRADDGILGLAWLQNDLLGESRWHTDGQYLCCLYGDLIDYQAVPWESLLSAIKERRYHELENYAGAFAISIYDSANKIFYAVSDRTSQQPLYYSVNRGDLVLSTAFSTFCRLGLKPDFNERWLYEYLYFNYPTDQVTPLKNVLRMRKASVLVYEVMPDKLSLHEYSGLFEKKEKLVAGREAIERAKHVFGTRIPKYIPDKRQTAVSLTSGFDSRTVLAFGLGDQSATRDIETFTYGQKGCADIMEAARVSSALGLRHHKILLDQRFEDELSKLIYFTVYISQGQERISRAELAYSYDRLTESGTKIPVVVTGLAGDHLFRDHIKGMGNVPAIISADMMKTIHSGDVCINRPFFREAFGPQFDDFESSVRDSLKKLEKLYGPLSRPEPYLSFLIYEVSPKHFAGEAAVAGNYTTLRSPYWDPAIISLSYEIALSTLGFSESAANKNKYLECVLQASLIQTNPALAKLSIKGVPIWSYTLNNRALHGLTRTWFRGPEKLGSYFNRSEPARFLDWNKWINVTLKQEINRLTTKESWVSQYLSPAFIERIKQEGNLHWISRIVTAEIILRLVHSGWTMEKAA